MDAGTEAAWSPMNAETWLSVALGEIADHTAEIPGPAANPQIVQYNAVTTLKATSDEVPWCSSFACWVMEQAGAPSTKSMMARSWLNWAGGEMLSLPRFGAIVVLARGAKMSNQGHVGFLVSSRPGRVAILGGNQGDQVSIEWYDESRVLGYRWPKEKE
mgnify:CR=1 FL=1